jgi:RNA-directed DNA polymerase
MHTDTALRRLEALPDLAQADKRINGLFRLLTYRPLWTEGLERIKRNKGAGTPGVDGSTVSTLGETDIETIIQTLVDGTYRPKPVKRVYIPKANGKLRPLGIPTAQDRLVQEVVRSILNRIYEPVFSPNSHGFREKRSCHTALESFLKRWGATKWLVDVDVEGFFDNIDHTILLSLLSKRIEDEKFLSLISGMLKAGFLENWRFNETYSGTPQGGVVSPLLANIYLHELDLFVEQLRENFDKGERRRNNRAYFRYAATLRRLKLQISQLRNEGRIDEASELLRKHDEVRAEMVKMPSVDWMDPGFKRLRYVRYADDFLIGIIGSKADARDIMAQVEEFLRLVLNLKVSPEKSGIRKASDGARFLGHDVQVYTGKYRVRYKPGRGRPALVRTLVEKTQISVPYEKVQAFAKRHGYGTFASLHAMHRTELLHLDDLEIVKVYNAEFRGFAMFYALAFDVKRNLSKLSFLWSTSLFKTLAHKHKSSVQAMVDKVKVQPGVHIVRETVNGKVMEVKVWKLADLKRKSVFENVDTIPNTSSLRLGRTSFAQRRAIEHCSHCSTTEGPFHLHHPNPVRNIKRTGYDKLRQSRARKVIPLCTSCHQLSHSGKLPDLRSSR